MSGRISVVSNTGSSSGGTTGGGSIGPSITSGGTLSASLQGTSYKLVVDEPPDLMINLETNAYEQRMPDFSDFKMRIEDSNVLLFSRSFKINCKNLNQALKCFRQHSNQQLAELSQICKLLFCLSSAFRTIQIANI